MATFQIDAAHTDILFSTKHMMVTTVRGKFSEVTGSIDIDENDPTRSTADLTVSVASVDTGFGARDAHLRSDDFFAAERFPELRVTSTAIRAKGGNDFIVTADVTIHGITRSVDFQVEFLGFYTAMDGARRAGFSAKAKVNRKDWDLNWNVALEAGGWLVGEQVKLEVEVAVQEATAAAVQEATAIAA